jgi:hypothetical protein
MLLLRAVAAATRGAIGDSSRHYAPATRTGALPSPYGWFLTD